MRCFWVDSVADRSTSDSSGPPGDRALAPCAVVSDCQQCSGHVPTSPRFHMHGQEHVYRHGRAMLLHEHLCGLQLGGDDPGTMARGRPAWVEQMVASVGPGVYLVFPAVDADGLLVGVDPIEIDMQH